MQQKKKISRKVISVVLSLLMVFSTMTGLVPGMSLTAQAATEKTVAGLGTSAISNPTSTESSATAWAGNYVYYGKYNDTPTKYRVLDKASNDFGVVGSSLLLDCDTTLYNVIFHDSSNVWSSSTLRSGLQGDAFLNKSGVFTEQEKGAIASSTKEADVTAADVTDANGKTMSSSVALSDDTVFVLDVKEASRASYGYASNGTRKKSGTSTRWWLRSPRKSGGNAAGYVYTRGDFVTMLLGDNDQFGASPAFNISLSSVIFSSVITGTAGEAGAEYKLTLKDDKISVDLTSGEKVTKSGDTLTIPYTVSGDNAGNANQVSVLVTDKAYTDSDATILKYGKLADVTGSTLSGEADFDLPSGLTGTPGTDYHIYLLAEDVNGAKETDYANLKEITVNSRIEQTVTAPTAATGLTYKKDQAQALLASGAVVTEGNKTEGSIQYKVGTDGTWSSEIPKATNAGTYDVYYKVLGDDTYAEYAPADPISVTIAKADPETLLENVYKVIDAINALPASDKVATTDKAAIEAARKAYDALTADQKKKVPADVLKKLTDAEKALKAAKELEAAKKEAQAAMNEQVTVTQKGNKFTVKWKKAKSADGYYVYAQYCGKKFKKPVKTIKKNTTTKVTIKKINGKKLNLKKQFRVYVVPYKIIDGKKVKLGKSMVGHVVGSKNTKYSNVKKLTLKKKKYTVKVGKTAKIKAKVTLVNKNKKHIPKGHGAKFRYKSSDTNIATVSKNGKIKGIKKGKCTIYVYSINGLTKKAKITVK